MAVGSLAAFPVSASVILTSGRAAIGDPLPDEESAAEAGVVEVGLGFWGPSLHPRAAPDSARTALHSSHRESSTDRAGSRSSSPH